MKTLIKINFLVITAIAGCNIAQGQQKASDKSFNSLLMEAKQRQAMRNKMLQQMKQTTPDKTSQNNSTDNKPSNTGIVRTTSTQQTAIPGEGTNQQAINNQPSNQPVKVQRSKKQ